MLAVLLLFVAAALPAHADDGDMDEITHYTVTVDTRADGSADITYELDWNVIGGSLDEPLTWVRIGLPNSHNDSLVNLTPDTVLNVSSVDDGGSFAKVDFINAYFPPDIAATIGAQSSVHFAFQVHQSHLFLLNEDGNADYSFTPGWFDDLCVDKLTIRWVALDGIQADNDSQDGNYLVWNFGPLDHGRRDLLRRQAARVQRRRENDASHEFDYPVHKHIILIFLKKGKRRTATPFLYARADRPSGRAARPAAPPTAGRSRKAS